MSIEEDPNFRVITLEVPVDHEAALLAHVAEFSVENNVMVRYLSQGEAAVSATSHMISLLERDNETIPYASEDNIHTFAARTGFEKAALNIPKLLGYVYKREKLLEKGRTENIQYCLTKHPDLVDCFVAFKDNPSDKHATVYGFAPHKLPYLVSVLKPFYSSQKYPGGHPLIPAGVGPRTIELLEAYTAELTAVT